jgi:hypothetical protein
MQDIDIVKNYNANKRCMHAWALDCQDGIFVGGLVVDEREARRRMAHRCNVYLDHLQWRPDLQIARGIRHSATIPPACRLLPLTKKDKTLQSARAPWEETAMSSIPCGVKAS